MSAINTMIYWWCLSDIAILNIKGADDCCIISVIKKIEAINLMQNIDLSKKSRTL